MDIRGIEVTNQLRSAIRAKLIELGVRYDEELPDYILVMVVNKKSRQQMHEDLNLFLENSTTIFVDWLHDQVLKKLQKVTVAKKKVSKELVPTVIVKQEEEKRKRKTSTTSFLEDQTGEQGNEKSIHKTVKEDKSLQKEIVEDSLTISNHEMAYDRPTKQHTENDNARQNDEFVIGAHHKQTLNRNVSTEVSEKVQSSNSQKEIISIKPVNKLLEAETSSTGNSELIRQFKGTSVADNECNINERKKKDTKRSRINEDNNEEEEDSPESKAKKIRSSVNKISSAVIPVKNRLGAISPRKKFEIYRGRPDNESHSKQSGKQFQKRLFGHRSNISPLNKNSESNEKRNRVIDKKSSESERVTDIRNRLGTSKTDKLHSFNDGKERISCNEKVKALDRISGTIKDRLGISSNHFVPRATSESQEFSGYKHKIISEDRIKGLKSRLGNAKNNFKPQSVKPRFNAITAQSEKSEVVDSLSLIAVRELNLHNQSGVNTGPIKSHIIAVKKPTSVTSIKPQVSLKKVNKSNAMVQSDIEDEGDTDDQKLSSKVIVTPRPLKPLQPVQKRATQSLLLKAMAEANQSVVKQKNPEPTLPLKKSLSTRLKPSIPKTKEITKNLAINLSASKRMVMEKIQVELHTLKNVDKQKVYKQPGVTNDHMGVVMSLFQRTNDRQKFLVTLNGYDNTVEEQEYSEDEQQLEMEVNDDEEQASSMLNDSYNQSDLTHDSFQITDPDEDVNDSTKDKIDENNENCNTENMEVQEIVLRKSRKLSPIVFNRTDSPSFTEMKDATATSLEKVKERCRYWPNCTLASKCAYYHPAVMCSAFPACKFGDKCAYKHPKCKFGLSCTKLGCVFAHPAQQCKYHPFCTKPACPFSHPEVSATPISVETSTQRAKFTWRRRD
ncbi:zinc finger CCCH domain-containing protein 14 isoform X2 [Prorops nasuta]|uniref:zinc finger CCCH domain-containing protein 14 isoform X2 n=1 Tax=Prorops nasuta TaxID=863751 RepID=UPI0034CD807C